MSVPAGAVEIEAGGAKSLGRATVRVTAGQATSVDLVLRERPLP